MTIFGLFRKSRHTKPLVLVVLDGYGIAPKSTGNAIHNAETSNMDKFAKNYPSGELIASGESVGLPANEVGNTEVGHLTMGAGRVVLQDVRKINQSVEDGSFFKNEEFNKAREHVRKHKSTLHIMGIVSSGNVHASLKHFWALMEFCKRKNIRNVCYDLITDGRDAPPEEGIKVVAEIEKRIKEMGFGRISSVCGRYYAMDRDTRWERTQKAYDALVHGVGKTAKSAIEAVKISYEKKITDEFIEPTLIHPVTTINNNDAVIFTNFRIDRARQLAKLFVEGDVKNLYFVTMTQYDENLPVSGIAYSLDLVANPLAKVISDAGLAQFHTTESEKERFVTFYFDGQREGRFKGEDFQIVPSPKVETYDKKPEMSSEELIAVFKNALKKDKYSFILINFPNPDMVAHTGNTKATIKAIEATDSAVGEVIEATLAVNGNAIITADHGNAEELLTYPTKNFFFTSSGGDMNTDHSNNPVPVIFVGEYFKNKSIVMGPKALCDIAPTILTVLGLKVPSEMEGKNLLK